jgi:hypothetical protein
MYVSHFMHPAYKRNVKPVVEIMAALPSVVLGFLAGLWLAPRSSRRSGTAPDGAGAAGLGHRDGDALELLPASCAQRLPVGTEAFAFAVS